MYTCTCICIYRPFRLRNLSEILAAAHNDPRYNNHNHIDHEHNVTNTTNSIHTNIYIDIDANNRNNDTKTVPTII